MFEEKTASDIADQVLLKLAQLQRKPISLEELSQLEQDIGNALAVSGGQEASKIVPDVRLRKGIQELEKGSPAQTRAGLGGGVAGGILGGGAGMIINALSRGRAKAPLGLLSAIPGAMAGYGFGKEKQRRKELREVLGTHVK